MSRVITSDNDFFLKKLVYTLAAFPPLYILVVIQYGAITVPFWDHVELIRWIAAWYDGTFHFSSLWAHHNQTRPLVYRFVMLFNAVLTNWDIRSEYIYMYLALYGTFAIHVWTLRRVVAGTTHAMVFPVFLLLLSLIVFSPVGHNNHWWSMMFQLNAANLFIPFAMLSLFVRPRSWASHVIAAIGCWLAAYTLTNGIFAVIAIGLVFQLSATRLLQPSRQTWFWAVNLLVLLACYIPGIPLAASSVRPSAWQLLEFCLAYLGEPLRGLLWFPYQNMFDIPRSIVGSVICGTLLLSSCVVLCRHAWSKLREQETAALVLFGFTAFSIVSALATAWGRATFDDFGIANANASRYSIFGVYLLLGQLYYVAAGFAHDWWTLSSRQMLVRNIAVGMFVFLSLVTYVRAVRVYEDAHQFNQGLLDAYPWGLQHTDKDRSIYPNPDTVDMLRRDLQRLELGPYSSRPFERQVLPIGEFKTSVLLFGNQSVSQWFQASEDGLKAVAIKFVKPNGMHSGGIISWQLNAKGAAGPLASGNIDGARLNDGEPYRLKLPYLGDSRGRNYQIKLSSSSDNSDAAGVPLYEPAGDGNEAVEIVGQSDPIQMEHLSMALRLEYAK